LLAGTVAFLGDRAPRATLETTRSNPSRRKAAPCSEDQLKVATFFRFSIALPVTKDTFEKLREWNGRAISVVFSVV
jgi:hypothetical protein